MGEIQVRNNRGLYTLVTTSVIGIPATFTTGYLILSLFFVCLLVCSTPLAIYSFVTRKKHKTKWNIKTDNE